MNYPFKSEKPKGERTGCIMPCCTQRTINVIDNDPVMKKMMNFVDKKNLAYEMLDNRAKGELRSQIEDVRDKKSEMVLKLKDVTEYLHKFEGWVLVCEANISKISNASSDLGCYISRRNQVLCDCDQIALALNEECRKLTCIKTQLEELKTDLEKDIRKVRKLCIAMQQEIDETELFLAFKERSIEKGRCLDICKPAQNDCSCNLMLNCARKMDVVTCDMVELTEKIFSRYRYYLTYVVSMNEKWKQAIERDAKELELLFTLCINELELSLKMKNKELSVVRQNIFRAQNAHYTITDSIARQESFKSELDAAFRDSTVRMRCDKEAGNEKTFLKAKVYEINTNINNFNDFHNYLHMDIDCLRSAEKACERTIGQLSSIIQINKDFLSSVIAKSLRSLKLCDFK